MFFTLIKYSAALFGLLKAAFIAATHSSFGYPIEVNSSIALSYSGPDTKSPPYGPYGEGGTTGVVAGLFTGAGYYGGG